jgi:hypothetical protein
MEAIDLDKGVLRGAQNKLKDSFVEAPQASAIVKDYQMPADEQGLVIF